MKKARKAEMSRPQQRSQAPMIVLNPVYFTRWDPTKEVKAILGDTDLSMVAIVVHHGQVRCHVWSNFTRIAGKFRADFPAAWQSLLKVLGKAVKKGIPPASARRRLRRRRTMAVDLRGDTRRPDHA